MTILYAEDDSMTVMEVQEKLENNGYEVIVAYDGNEALEKFIACKPDLIVLDVDMPGKDGLEVLQFIRLQDSQTPVIIYSCLIDEEKQIKGLEWGANVYLLKNYSPTLLLAQIQRCIARSGEEVIRLSKQVEYDFSACNLRVSDVVYHLTMLENKIFSILCKNRNTLVAREDLLKAGCINGRMGTHHPFYFAGTGIDESQGITVFIKMSCLAVRTETVVSNTVGNDSDGQIVSQWA